MNDNVLPSAKTIEYGTMDKELPRISTPQVFPEFYESEKRKLTEQAGDSAVLMILIITRDSLHPRN